MRIAISGATGLIGSRLIPALIADGHNIALLVRSTNFSQPKSAEVIQWDIENGVRDFATLEDYDAIVNLAGDNVAEGRWTEAKKRRIQDSRVRGTRVLVDALGRLQRPPTVFVCASAVGYYGDRADEVLNESSTPGNDFLSKVCIEWERAAQNARRLGIRVVNLRFGAVLSRHGGALAKMLGPFKIGAGGKIGEGTQFISWISIDDAIRVIQTTLTSENIEGPVNTVTPWPVRNAEFTSTLATVLRKPALLTVPAFAVRLMFGEMADALLLASTRVQPRVLESEKFQFRFPNLRSALEHALIEH